MFDEKNQRSKISWDCLFKDSLSVEMVECKFLKERPSVDIIYLLEMILIEAFY